MSKKYKIDIGEHGLYYLTETDTPGLFIAGVDRDEVLRLAEIAKDVMYVGEGFIPKHTLAINSNMSMTIPDAEWQTAEQHRETIKKMHMVCLAFFEIKGTA